MGVLIRLLFPLLLALTAQGVKTVDKNRRTVATDEPWARAVARLTCRDRAGKQVLGTAVLVAPDLALTAYHVAGGCVKSATLAFGYRSGAKLEARSVEKIVAGSAPGDWAILRLDRPITTIEPLKMAPLVVTRYDTAHLLVAGYSADVELGRGGEVLTFDAKCKLTRFERKKNVLHTNAVSYFGASGGPAFVRDRESGAYLWIGINHASTESRTTAGFRTYIVYQAMYKDALERALAARGQPLER